MPEEAATLKEAEEPEEVQALEEAEDETEDYDDISEVFAVAEEINDFDFVEELEEYAEPAAVFAEIEEAESLEDEETDAVPGAESLEELDEFEEVESIEETRGFEKYGIPDKTADESDIEELSALEAVEEIAGLPDQLEYLHATEDEEIEELQLVLETVPDRVVNLEKVSSSTFSYASFGNTYRGMDRTLFYDKASTIEKVDNKNYKLKVQSPYTSKWYAIEELISNGTVEAYPIVSVFGERSMAPAVMFKSGVYTVREDLYHESANGADKEFKELVDNILKSGADETDKSGIENIIGGGGIELPDLASDLPSSVSVSSFKSQGQLLLPMTVLIMMRFLKASELAQ